MALHDMICEKCGKAFQAREKTYQEIQKGTRLPYCLSCWKIMQSKVNLVDMLCEECGATFQISRGTLADWKCRNIQSLCNACRRKKKAESNKARWDKLTPEQQELIRMARAETSRKRIEELSPEERQANIDRLQEGFRRKQEELTKFSPEERKAYYESIGTSPSSWSEESRESQRKKLSEYHKQRCANRSEEEREAFREQQREHYRNLSDEEKAETLKAMLDGQHKWWQGLPEEERELFAAAHSETMKKKWDNMSVEERAAYADLRKFSNSSWYENSFHKKFIQAFESSILSEEYTLQPEYTTINRTNHGWDFGVLQNGELVAVIDLDGAYYHADNCDYDGIHSQEERDDERVYSVEDGIKIFIINELKFAKSFEELINGLKKDYQVYLADIFKMCRHMQFPNPYYSNRELLASYRKLLRMDCTGKYTRNISVNTRLGDRLIQHFHYSIWSAHVKGKPSPRDAWNNDELLKKVIRNRTIYQNYLNPNKILQGFNVSKVAPKVSVFSAGRAKMIIHKYLGEYTTIFDPFSGFSGRMLGAISLGKDYLGQDISEIHVRESNKIIQFLRDHGFELNAEVIQADITKSYGEYPCLFTCPPYGDKEIWLEVPPDKRTCDDWIDICLEHFKCHRYVFVVDHTEKYKEYVVEEIQNRSHFNKGSECLIVIDRI